MRWRLQMAKYKINNFEGEYTITEALNLTMIAIVEDLQNKFDDYMSIMVKDYKKLDEDVKETFRTYGEKYVKSLFSHLRKRKYMK